MKSLLNKNNIALDFSPSFGNTRIFDDFGSIITHLVKNFMTKISKPNFLTAKNQINQVSEADLKKALSEVEKRNIEVRKSFKSDSDAMSLRAGR